MTLAEGQPILDVVVRPGPGWQKVRQSRATHPRSTDVPDWVTTSAVHPTFCDSDSVHFRVKCHGRQQVQPWRRVGLGRCRANLSWTTEPGCTTTSPARMYCQGGRKCSSLVQLSQGALTSHILGDNFCRASHLCCDSDSFHCKCYGRQLAPNTEVQSWRREGRCGTSSCNPAQGPDRQRFSLGD